MHERKSTKITFRWYVYVLILNAIGLIRLAEKVFNETGGFASRYLPLVLTLAVSIGVYGCIASRPIYKRWIWRLLLNLLIVISIGLLIFAGYLLFFAGASAIAAAMGLLFIFIVLLPGLIKLQQYSSKSAEFWHS